MAIYTRKYSCLHVLLLSYICPPSVKPNHQMINSINLLLYKYACWLIIIIDLFDITHRLAMHIIREGCVACMYTERQKKLITSSERRTVGQLRMELNWCQHNFCFIMFENRGCKGNLTRRNWLEYFQMYDVIFLPIFDWSPQIWIWSQIWNIIFYWTLCKKVLYSFILWKI